MKVAAKKMPPWLADEEEAPKKGPKAKNKPMPKGKGGKGGKGGKC